MQLTDETTTVSLRSNNERVAEWRKRSMSSFTTETCKGVRGLQIHSGQCECSLRMVDEYLFDEVVGNGEVCLGAIVVVV